MHSSIFNGCLLNGSCPSDSRCVVIVLLSTTFLLVGRITGSFIQKNIRLSINSSGQSSSSLSISISRCSPSTVITICSSSSIIMEDAMFVRFNTPPTFLNVAILNDLASLAIAL
eukprot:NODE_159_length_16647_cov_0.251390.p8 type:complete len:114 gc:universal NODE_159_length_16647_cov_0.251390:14191-13850(-)